MLAKIIVTVATLLYGIAPLIADLNVTHVLHPDWTPHSRLHMVWLLSTNSSLAAFALWIVWSRNQPIAGAVLGLLVMFGFWIAVGTSSLYGGALYDAGGIETLILGFEGNVLAFAVVTVLLVAGILVRIKNP